MQVRFWGTRGSIAKPGPDTVRYGGNTSCVQIVSSAGTLLIIDCGTGAHGLGQMLIAAPDQPLKGHVLISHTHWDHIQGIPFFAPFFVPGNEWDFYAPKGFGESLRETLAGQMEYTYFPITPEAFGAQIKYNNLSEGSFRIDDILIRTRYLNHPALTLAFRIEVDGVAIVYACDHEPHSRALARAEGPLEGQDQFHAEFMRDADLVIHDAQYLASEYPAKVGWGHSTVEYAVRICQAVGVRQLALTHHDPMRTDDELDIVIDGIRENLDPAGGLDVFGAREGMILDLVGSVRRAEPVLDSAPATTTTAQDLPSLMIVSGDEALDRKVFEAMREEAVRCLAAPTSAAALRLYAESSPAIVLIDNDLPSGGAALARAIRALPGDEAAAVPILIVGGDTVDALGSLGAQVEWLQTPFSAEYARARIRTWMMRGEFRWLRASTPENEAGRLQALHALMLFETGPEERFDRYTRIASGLFNVPCALVTLVGEDRQWFKSCNGFAGCETSRDASFCAHAIHSREVMVVSDTLRDARFADNPLVTGEPRIRSYAGVPLFLADGHCVGTLCVLDVRPREFSDEERRLLADLGGLVAQELVMPQLASPASSKEPPVLN